MFRHEVKPVSMLIGGGIGLDIFLFIYIYVTKQNVEFS